MKTSTIIKKLLLVLIIFTPFSCDQFGSKGGTASISLEVTQTTKSSSVLFQGKVRSSLFLGYNRPTSAILYKTVDQVFYFPVDTAYLYSGDSTSAELQLTDNLIHTGDFYYFVGISDSSGTLYETTSDTFQVTFTKVLKPATLSHKAYINYVDLIATTNNNEQVDSLIVYRSFQSSDYLLSIDTIMWYDDTTIRYRDITNHEGTIYYAVQEILKSGATTEKSNITSVIHDPYLPAPELIQPVDSLMEIVLRIPSYSYEDYSPSRNIYMINGTDTTLLTNITSNSSSTYRFDPHKAGIFSFASAGVYEGVVGHLSPWTTMSFLNQPLPPEYRIEDKELQKKVSSLRSRACSTFKAILYKENSGIQWEKQVSGSSSWGASFIDTITEEGTFYYELYAIDSTGVLSEPTITPSFYMSGILPPPSFPEAKVSQTYIEFDSRKDDTLLVYRSRTNDGPYDSIPLIYYPSSYEGSRYRDTSILNVDPGTFYYKFKKVRFGLTSPFSEPLAIKFPSDTLNPSYSYNTIQALDSAIRIRLKKSYYIWPDTLPINLTIERRKESGQYIHLIDVTYNDRDTVIYDSSVTTAGNYQYRFTYQMGKQAKHVVDTFPAVSFPSKNIDTPIWSPEHGYKGKYSIQLAWEPSYFGNSSRVYLSLYKDGKLYDDYDGDFDLENGWDIGISFPSHMHEPGDNYQVMLTGYDSTGTKVSAMSNRFSLTYE